MITAAVPVRVPKIVLTGWNFCSEFAVLSGHELVWFPVVGQAIKCLGGGDVRHKRTIEYASVLAPTRVGRRGEFELLSIAPPYDEYPASKLRNPVVRRQEYFPLGVVAEFRESL